MTLVIKPGIIGVLCWRLDSLALRAVPLVTRVTEHVNLNGTHYPGNIIVDHYDK